MKALLAAISFLLTLAAQASSEASLLWEYNTGALAASSTSVYHLSGDGAGVSLWIEETRQGDVRTFKLHWLASERRGTVVKAHVEPLGSSEDFPLLFIQRLDRFRLTYLVQPSTLAFPEPPILIKDLRRIKDVVQSPPGVPFPSPWFPAGPGVYRHDPYGIYTIGIKNDTYWIKRWRLD